MMTYTQAWISVLIISVVTAAIRVFPFIVFGGKRKPPKIVEKLSRLLPPAIMGMLVVFCLKGVSFESASGFLPSLIGCIIVAVSYIWKRNTLISIISGTAVYMLMVQKIL